MSLFEIISLSLSLLSAICVVFATWFGLRNLRLMISAHQDNHEWNRRLVTQNALNELRGMNKDLLNEVFKSEDLMTSIPLTAILEEFEKRHELQNLCHKVLNWYEGLASGIHLGIYDELTVKVNRKGTMEKNYANFREYIIYRRDLVGNEKVWVEQEKLMTTWRVAARSQSERPTTGSIK